MEKGKQAAGPQGTVKRQPAKQDRNAKKIQGINADQYEKHPEWTEEARK